MTYRHLTTEEIENWFDVKSTDVPPNVILHGTWPWEDKIENYSRFVKNPKKITKLGNFIIGTHKGMKIGYMVIYGPGMAADMCYILIKLGVKNLFLVGGIGALQRKINLGDLVIPEQSFTSQDGTSHFYSKKTTVNCDKKLLGKFEKVLVKRNFKNYHVGKTLSISTLFAENRYWVNKWSNQGALGVDMETSAVYTLAKTFGVRAIALLQVIDSLVTKGKTVDKMDRNERADKLRGNRGKIMLDILLQTIKSVR